MKLLIGTSTDPAYNLAREEVLLEQEEDVILLWQNRPSVIVGRNQNTLQELDEAFCKAHQIDVVRRITGGGAVYHDLGNINYSFLFSCCREHPFEERVAECRSLLLEVLWKSGVSALCSGRNDICVKQGEELRKISGCAMLQRKERGLFHGTLLYDADLEQMRRALTPSRLKLQSKGILSVRSRVANLRQIGSMERALCGKSCAWYMKHLAQSLQEKTRATLVTDESLREPIERLAEEQYRAWEWNYGNNPACSLQQSGRFPAGTVQIGLEIKGGRIKECRIWGDYFDTEAAQQVEAGLSGVPYEKEEARNALKQLPFEACFGIGQPEPLLKVLFQRKESGDGL